MALIPLKCPQCNGDLQMESTLEFGFCQYCGSKIMVQQEIVKIINNISAGASVQNQFTGETTINNYTVSKGFSGQYIYPIMEEGHYDGPMLNGRPHGKGIFFWPGGVRYEGDFVNGVIEGFGKKYYPDGYYEGSFKNNRREGQGKYFYSEGGTYEGTYVNDMKDGLGHETGETDDGITWEYDGMFRKDMRNGKGTLRWSNGSYYKGDFVDGNRTGIGYIKSKDHEVFGEFRKGKMNGEVRYIWYNHNPVNAYKYEGKTENNEFSGPGIMYYPSYTVYCDNYVSGKRQGLTYVKYAYGKRTKGTSRDSVLYNETVCLTIPDEYIFTFDKIKYELGRHDYEIASAKNPNAPGNIIIKLPDDYIHRKNKFLCFQITKDIKGQLGDTVQITLTPGRNKIKFSEVHKDGLFSSRYDYSLDFDAEINARYAIYPDGLTYKIKKEDN